MCNQVKKQKKSKNQKIFMPNDKLFLILNKLTSGIPIVIEFCLKIITMIYQKNLRLIYETKNINYHKN